MRSGRIVFALSLLAVSCNAPAPRERSQLINIAVSGAGECLGRIARRGIESNSFGVAVQPKGSGRIDMMELGPVPAGDFDRVRAVVEGFHCASHVERMPCRTPDTDVMVCGLK